MNIKTSIRYQIKDQWKAVLIYGLIILVVLVLFSVDAGNGNMNGIEFSTMIFLFVVGLNSFKENLGMFLQNGVTRKSMFLGRLGATAVISAILTVYCEILIIVMEFTHSSKLSILYGMMYPERAVSLALPLIHLENILIMFCCFLLFSTFGYLITIAYYRMGKTAKICVSVGVPAVLLVFLPYVDSVFFHGGIFLKLYQILLLALGINSGNPYIAMGMILVLTGVLTLLSWLMMRKAVMKS